MQTSTAIAIVVAPIVHALFARLVLRPLTGFLHKRIRSERVRATLFKKIG